MCTISDILINPIWGLGSGHWVGLCDSRRQRGFSRPFYQIFQVFRVLDVSSIGRAEEKNFNGGFMEEKYLSYLDGRKQLYGR